jgi:hypothetical protein
MDKAGQSLKLRCAMWLRKALEAAVCELLARGRAALLVVLSSLLVVVFHPS